MTKKQFLNLLEPLEPKLFGFAYRMLRNDEQVKDAMQELMLKLWKKRKQLNKNQNISAYCFRTLNHICIDVFRHQGRLLTVDMENEGTGMALSGLSGGTSEKMHEEKDLIRHIRRIVSDLPIKQRTIIELHDFQEFSHAEIAEMLEMEISAVRTNLSRARAKITSLVRKEEIYE